MQLPGCGRGVLRSVRPAGSIVLHGTGVLLCVPVVFLLCSWAFLAALSRAARLFPCVRCPLVVPGPASAARGGPPLPCGRASIAIDLNQSLINSFLAMRMAEKMERFDDVSCIVHP